MRTPLDPVLNTNGLAAADEVIIPLESSILALEALPQFERTVAEVQREINPALIFRGIFITKPSTGHSQAVLAHVQARHPGKVFQALIPLSVAAKDSLAAGQSVFSYNPRSALTDRPCRAGELIDSWILDPISSLSAER
jgi:chromosome partitioning protein